MMVTHHCKQCNLEFDGHWHERENRRKQFPAFKELSDWEITQVCPYCGHFNKGARNVDCDEDFNDYGGNEDEEFEEEGSEGDK